MAWSWLKRFLGRRDATAEGPNPFSQLRWVAAADNDYGVDLLDCTLFCQSLLALSHSAEVATTFTTLRHSSGEDYRGRRPRESMKCPCVLRYPPTHKTKDGPIFKAQVMEDKWDIYLYDGHLYFARSWTGDLFFRAAIMFRDEEARITCVEAKPEAVENDPDYAIAVVNHLVRLHLYGQPMPHPLPKSLKPDAQEIAVFSFNLYGRYGFFATFADTTKLKMPQRDNTAAGG